MICHFENGKRAHQTSNTLLNFIIVLSFLLSKSSWITRTYFLFLNFFLNAIRMKQIHWISICFFLLDKYWNRVFYPLLSPSLTFTEAKFSANAAQRLTWVTANPRIYVFTQIQRQRKKSTRYTDWFTNTSAHRKLFLDPHAYIYDNGHQIYHILFHISQN